MSERFVLARNVDISIGDWANIKSVCSRAGVRLPVFPDRIHIGAAMASAVVQLENNPTCEDTIRVHEILSRLNTAVEGTGDFYLLKVEASSPLPGLLYGVDTVETRARTGPVKKFRVASAVWELSDEHIFSNNGVLFQSERRNRDMLVLTMEEFAELCSEQREMLRVGRGVWLPGEPIGTAGHWAVAVDNKTVRLSDGKKTITNGAGEPLINSDFQNLDLDPGDIAADVLNCPICELTEADRGGTFWRDGNENNRVTVLYYDEAVSYNAEASDIYRIPLDRRYGQYVIYTHVCGTWHGKNITREFDPMKNENE